MNERLEELINLCNNLDIEITENEKDVDIVLGNQEVSIDKITGRTDNYYYPTVKAIIKVIGNW